MADGIDYSNLMHAAMRALIREVLDEVARNGLPGAHHFFITFDTSHPDAELADWLSDRYPDEMTVVMQYWYDNLHVDENGFAVTLNFGDSPESLYVPYDAIKTFVDPSVEFGLRFEPQNGNDNEVHAPDVLPQSQTSTTRETDKGKKNKPADIVSLDSFRK